MQNDNLSYAEYRAREAFSYSTAKAILNSPNKWALGIEKPRTQALDFGSLAHDLILSPAELDKKYLFAEFEKLDLRLKECKEAKAQADAQGLIVIDKATLDLANSAISANKAILDKYIDLQGDCEVSFFDKIDGVDCKCRADFVCHDENLIIDLKFVRDASAHGFSKACVDFGYHIQNALYCDIVGADRFLFIAIEKEYPFLCGIYELSVESIDLGRDLYHRALKIYQNQDKFATQCYKGVDLEFGISNEIQKITLPTYAFYQ